MAAARSVMLLSGVTLLILTLVAGLLRVLDLASTQRVPPELFWTILFVGLGLGVVLLIFLPPSRKTERRVDLKPSVTQDKLVRPQTGGRSRADLPVTRTAAPKKPSSQKKQEGPSTPSPKQTTSSGQTGTRDGEGKKQESNGSSLAPGEGTPPPSMRNGNGRSDGTTRQPPAVARGEGRTHGDLQPVPDKATEGDSPQRPPSLRSGPTWRDEEPGPHGPVLEESSRPQGQLSERHPEAPPSLRGSGSLPDDRFAQQSISVSQDADALERMGRRREELESRLEYLDQRANSAKVSVGLGRISHAGYRQYMKEVERERTLIEGELIALRDN